MPGLVSFSPYEEERIMRARIMRLGFSPKQIDEMDAFEQLELLEIDQVVKHFEYQHMAQLVAIELSKVKRKR
jgi:hypothetical protein